MFEVHQQTIRLYEKQGLITPKRSAGNTRQFAEEDVDRLEEIIYLTHKLGINIAGVQMILKQQKKIKKLQGEVNKLFESEQGKLQLEYDEYKGEIESQASKLVGMKKDDEKDDDEEVIDWEVEYDSEES